MSTQPIPTFPMLAGFEDYYGLSPIDVVDRHLEENPDIKNIFGDVTPTAWASAKDEAEYLTQYIPRMFDFVLELVKIKRDKENTSVFQRLSSNIFSYEIYLKDSPFK
jgi:hypothetical protein